ncbi:phosphopantetheine adenylyltransferase [Swaminathania salitolerans]|uniref:Phosphopantetheine adenylyltransferase n=1 Tax=Swaminathania salitolerans TaxID=182838 RepID=A0A511BMG3_9PROT|nr:phosphopantetheine adenylyltransferase [Swaminathania salitolerans]
MQTDVSPNDERVGFYPGTFDPFTLGHLDIARRALSLVDRLVIGVSLNPGKAPRLPVAERCEAIAETFARENISRVQVASFNTLMVDAARAHGAQFVIRGLRSESDLTSEMPMAAINRRLAPELETVFLTAREEHRLIASSLVRELLVYGGDIRPYVPENIARRLLSNPAEKPT